MHKNRIQDEQLFVPFQSILTSGAGGGVRGYPAKCWYTTPPVKVIDNKCSKTFIFFEIMSV